MDYLSEGDLIFGEKREKLYRRSNGTVTEITGFPTVLASGQGGLPDIRVHPEYAANGWIYSSYSAANPGSGGQLRLIRYKIGNNQVQNIEYLFTTNGSNSWNGNLLVGGLASRKLYRCVNNNNKVTSEHIIPEIDGRVRNVIQAPDGSIYVSVQNPGRIIQIPPG